jgi:hypothetical protein
LLLRSPERQPSMSDLSLRLSILNFEEGSEDQGATEGRPLDEDGEGDRRSADLLVAESLTWWQLGRIAH